ncbi:hypothetical protein N7499_003123 [Penicillium canescens]|uniref:Uncharacterized protein n=1 Tax=Penicillium canescens TaxID=5083 RepID=A0AAD6N7R8_PENCN|nr:uncharacterized protein N7446_011995 [Penicillium canescens]KAJ6039070.1 hypothetical protein N7460_007102 [Penicillium canescens]KAJ6047161.1 hypothetical protein N7446_011995 [Penicillium canescens]KAJ6059909.1 hypothetical protein N7444_003548 [Penicillium canescens]KAJ6093792.1 hypothetical protein N7499_003123 [Penicillium canescens]KAJ6174413.1 hypothetical protein N7485_005479 [Penicillium canescens]
MSPPQVFQPVLGMPFNQGDAAYIGLGQESDVESEEDYENNTSPSKLLIQALSLNTWLLATIVSLVLFFGKFRQLRCDNGINIWNMPDSDMAAPLLKFEKRRFTHGVRDDPDGTLYASINPNELQYAGRPNHKIDENWNELIVGRYFRLEDSEVSRLNRDPELPALTEMPASERISQEGFYGGPDVLHSLHCLNAIRKHLDPEYYGNSMTLPPELRRMHIDHCIDHLRQSVLCHGDLTPVTMKPVTANTSLPYPVTFYLGQTEREHTCRSTEAIWNWVTARGQRTGRIEPHHDIGP